MMEGRDREPELPRDRQHHGHVVRGIAVDVGADPPVEHAGERLELEVAAGRPAAAVVALALALLVQVLARALPGSPHHRDLALPARRCLALRTEVPLGILAAGHLESLRRVGKLDVLHRAAGHRLQHHGPTAEQVHGAGQHLQRRDTASQGERERRVLRVDGVLDARLGDVGGAHFRHVPGGRIPVDDRQLVRAVVAVDVDEARRQPAPRGLDHAQARRARQPAAQRGDLAVAQQDVRAFMPPADAVEDRGAGDEHVLLGQRSVGAGQELLRRRRLGGDRQQRRGDRRPRGGGQNLRVTLPVTRRRVP
jgi:hypothetical protein